MGGRRNWHGKRRGGEGRVCGRGKLRGGRCKGEGDGVLLTPLISNVDPCGAIMLKRHCVYETLRWANKYVNRSLAKVYFVVAVADTYSVDAGVIVSLQLSWTSIEGDGG